MTDETQPKLPAALKLHTGGKIAPVIPSSIEDCFRIAQAVVTSGMAPRDVKSSEHACVIIMHGLEVGVPPMAALQGISNINGRPCVWGDLALGIVRASGLLEEFEERIEGPEGADNRIAYCTVKRRGEKALTRKFSVADAKNAQLWGKRGQQGQPTPWVTYPERMLAMRARAWALRDAFADVLKGLHIREEIEDIAEPRDITPVPPPPPAAKANGKESGPKMEAVQGSSPARATDIPGGSSLPESVASTISAPGAEGVPGSVPHSPEAAGPTPASPAPSEYPELPKVLDRRNGAVDAEVVEDEPLQMFTAAELGAYLDDLEARYQQAPDRSSIEEVKAEFEEAGRPRMFPFDQRRADEAYGKAIDRSLGNAE